MGLIFLSSILIAGSTFSDPITTYSADKGSEQIESLMTVQEISCGPPKSTTTPPTTTPPETTTSEDTSTPNITNLTTTEPTSTVNELGLQLLAILSLGISMIIVIRRHYRG